MKSPDDCADCRQMVTAGRCAECRAEKAEARIAELEQKLQSQASSHGMYITQTLEPKIHELQERIRDQAKGHQEDARCWQIERSKQSERVSLLEREIEGAARYLEACGYGSGKLIQEGEPEAQMLSGFKKALQSRQAIEGWTIDKGIKLFTDIRQAAGRPGDGTILGPTNHGPLQESEGRESATPSASRKAAPPASTTVQDSSAAKCARDLVVYGTAMWKTNSDGTVEHVDPTTTLKPTAQGVDEK